MKLSPSAFTHWQLLWVVLMHRLFTAIWSDQPVCKNKSRDLKLTVILTGNSDGGCKNDWMKRAGWSGSHHLWWLRLNNTDERDRERQRERWKRSKIYSQVRSGRRDKSVKERVSSWLISVNREGEQAGLEGSCSKNNIAGEVAYCVLTDWAEWRRRRRSPLTDTLGGAEVSRNLGVDGNTAAELVSLLPRIIHTRAVWLFLNLSHAVIVGL